MGRKTCTRRWSLLMVAALITAPAANASFSDNGVLTAGVASPGLCGGGPMIYVGYLPAYSRGTYSPAVLTGGKTVSAVLDSAICPPRSELNVSGFSSNPGPSWLISVTCNGITNLSGTATYFYSNGRAGWQWSQQFGFTNGGTTGCTIVHN